MNINNPITIALLTISLGFSIIQGTAYAADKNTIIGPTKSPLSKTKILEPESSGSAERRNDYDGYGRGYNGYNNNDRNIPSSTRPKTLQSLQRNTTNQQAQEAARRKALPGGTKALSPTNTRTTQSLNRNPLSKAELKASKKKTLTTGVRSSSSPSVRRYSRLEKYERLIADLPQARLDVRHIESYVQLLNTYWGHISRIKDRLSACDRDTNVLLPGETIVPGSIYAARRNPAYIGNCNEQETRAQCYDRLINTCLDGNPNSPFSALFSSITERPSPDYLRSELSRLYNYIDEANNRVKRHQW